MAKISALTALARADVLDTDYIVVVDASAGVTKRMDIDSLLGALDGDQLDIDYTPTNYTPDAATPAEADDVDDLTAHLYGIDQKLNEIDNYGIEQADTTFTVSSTGHYIEIDTSGNPVTATLPSAATLGAGWNYIFKVTDATNIVTLATNGAETIDGASAFNLNTKNELLEVISDGTNWKIIRHDQPIKPCGATFAYADATSYTMTAGCYDLPTSLFKRVYWRGTLTMGPDTWAAGSTGIATTGWHYLYLDQSAIDGGTSAIIADSHFLSSTTAPTYDTTYMGWYNGNDRCIFAVRFKTASTLEEFWHSENYFWFGSYETMTALTDIDTTFTDSSGSGFTPTFVRALHCSFELYESTVDGTLTRMHVRCNGSSGSGWLVCGGREHTNDPDHNNSVMVVPCDSDRKIEIKASRSTAATLAVYLNGFLLPRGM